MDNKKDTLIKNLNLFKDKAFCHHSHYKAGQIWRKISNEIDPEFYMKISIEWAHVQIGHGFEQACMALECEIKKFIRYLGGDQYERFI
jgi:hypothetical protein